MTSNKIDLHIHSKFSDGLYTPEEIVEVSIEAGLKSIAIADHDSVSGVDIALATADGRIEVIPAVEMSSNIGNVDIHIIGYYIDHHSAVLSSYLEDFRQFRERRVKEIIKRLSVDGIKIDFQRIKEIASESALGRPHIAEILVENGYVASMGEAFIKYLGYHSPYYVPKKEVKPKEVIKKIKECKGIPVLAHPGTINGSANIIYSLINEGILGIEVWHPEHTRRQVDEFYEIGMKNGLILTGGSDFHGYPRGYTGIGECGCRIEDLQKLKELKNLQTNTLPKG
ncbi:MAG: PHP domain-containing protein [candidate division WOR-3 bacterium]